MSECARCGFPLKKMIRFLVSGNKIYCENCFKQITTEREELKK